MGRFIGPGYVRVGPVTAGPLGIGCLLPIITTFIIIVSAVIVL